MEIERENAGEGRGKYSEERIESKEKEGRMEERDRKRMKGRGRERDREIGREIYILFQFFCQIANKIKYPKVHLYDLVAKFSLSLIFGKYILRSLLDVYVGE